jgi:S1-C subfamily serine protease
MKDKETSHKRRWIGVITALALLAATLGCQISSNLLLATPSPSPPPTPTATAPQADSTSAPAEPANALEAQVEAVYEEASSGVVNITSVTYAYDFFFNPVPQEGAGSGFIYDEAGHIITNYHVVEDAEELSVTLANGKNYPAEIVGQDPANDLAVIKIDAETIPAPIPLGDSDGLRVGQFAVAIGNPFGLERTLTVGVVSSLGRVIEGPNGRFIGEVIQTDAAINPGNSGGPLLDLSGRVIGVNAQIVSPSQANAGIGFAVPVNTVRRVVPQLIEQGYYSHPWLGIQALSLSADRVEAFQEAGMEVPVERGVLIIEVVRGGPADQAGLRGGDKIVRFGNYRVPVGGDIITAIDDEPVTDFQDLTVYLETQKQVGDTVEVTFLRDGEEQVVTATLEERPGR